MISTEAINPTIEGWRKIRELKFGEDAELYQRAYLSANPLSKNQVADLCSAIRSGRQLCCKEGRSALAEIVDEVWVEELSHWAYEATSCRAIDEGERDEWVSKLRIKLNEAHDPKWLRQYRERAALEKVGGARSTGMHLYRVITNSDLNEGRGQSVTIGLFESFAAFWSIAA